MSKSSGILKAIGYAFGASVVASLGVLLVGSFVFGFGWLSGLSGKAESWGCWARWLELLAQSSA